MKGITKLTLSVLTSITCLTLSICTPDILPNNMLTAEAVYSYGDVNYDYLGDGTIVITGRSDESITSINIPSEIDGVAVTSIGDRAFEDVTTITSTSKKIKSITISDSITNIGDYAFNWCSDLTSITIPDSVTSIGDGAFNWCSGLTSITIPDSVTSIGYYTFSNCNNLTSIKLPGNITSIGEYTFSHCKNLTSITLPENIKTIVSGMFRYCDSLTSITIPQNISSIKSNAFYNCSSLNSITIMNPNCEIYDNKNTIQYTTTIYGFSGSTAEQYATKYNRKFVSLGNLAYKYLDDGTIEITSCSDRNATSIDIPSEINGKSVTRIGTDAFSNCYNLTSINIPYGVTSIGDYTFLSCYSLTSITIPDGVTSIGKDAFYNCYRLTSITIPDSVTNIGDSAFYECSNLKSIKIKNPKCEIYSSYSTISQNSIIYGYSESTAEEYADKYNREFIALDKLTTEKGDVNNNGKIDISDATLVLTIYAENASGLSIDEYSEEQLLAADVNLDGNVSISDATAILTYYARNAAGLDTSWADII